MLDKLKTAHDTEEATDHLGGGSYGVVESNVYQMEIKNMYMIQSSKGAIGVVLEGELDNGSKYTETTYISNRDGETFYVKDGKKFKMPGFITMDNICIIATGESLVDCRTDDKVVSMWDSESGKEVNRSVPVFVDVIGEVIAVAIQQIRENKTKENSTTGKWEPINEERILNQIVSVYDVESQKTVYEAMNDKDSTHWEAWKAKNEGKVWDKYKEVTGGGAGGRKGSPRKSIAQASAEEGAEAAAPKKNLFKKK